MCDRVFSLSTIEGGRAGKPGHQVVTVLDAPALGVAEDQPCSLIHIHLVPHVQVRGWNPEHRRSGWCHTCRNNRIEELVPILPVTSVRVYSGCPPNDLVRPEVHPYSS